MLTFNVSPNTQKENQTTNLEFINPVFHLKASGVFEKYKIFGLITQLDNHMVSAVDKNITKFWRKKS